MQAEGRGNIKALSGNDSVDRGETDTERDVCQIPEMFSPILLKYLSLQFPLFLWSSRCRFNRESHCLGGTVNKLHLHCIAV